MANLITQTIRKPPDTVKVDVDFYDAEEKRLFQNSIGTDDLATIPKELSISTAELCTYYLYYKLRPSAPGYTNHSKVAEKWAHALFEFDSIIEFNESSLRASSQNASNSGTTERLGEAIGLSVASEIHNLHLGDWSKIPYTTRQKVLDYERPLGSDGSKFIQVENKGSFVDDNSKKPSSVSNHKASIKAKKEKVTDQEKESALYYGTIGVVDPRPDSVVKCWLVDPPADVIGDPQRYKIITRLRFIANLLSVINPRSFLAAALQTHMGTLEKLESVTDLEGTELVNGYGNPFSTEVYDGDARSSVFASRSVVSDGPVGGQIVVINQETIVFIGMREELIAWAATNNFKQLLAYRFESAFLEKTIECVVPNGRFASEFKSALGSGRIKDAGNYKTFILQGQLIYSRSGFVFGVLPIPKSWQTEEGKDLSNKTNWPNEGF